MDNAIQITEPLPYTNTQETGGATVEIGESFPSCDPTASASVWYLFNPAIDYGNVSISTFGSSYDTLLSVWKGTEHPLTELACNDNASLIDVEQSNASQITIPLTENITYYIDVSGVDNATGKLSLRIEEGELDFKIISQPADKSIASCQTSTLTAHVANKKDGEQIDMSVNPIGSQWESNIALPFIYQWYQGESGDKSQLVAEIKNDTVFTTRRLAETTDYWVRISNPTGAIESDTVTVTVKENQAPNGDGVDAEGDSLSTDAHFSGFVTTSAEETEHLNLIKQTDPVFISYLLEVDVKHIQKSADILIVAAYTVNEQTDYFMRNGEMWELWDGNLAQLSATEENAILSKCIEIPVVSEGSLQNLPGQFTVYVGYRLKSNGDILFSGEPITFSVE